jgi:hypothetical protein
MKNDFVIVTALYNLNQLQRGDNRSWGDYLEWFSKTLKIKCPVIIFTQPDLKEFIEKCRCELPTHIITTAIEDIPYYNLKDSIQSVLDSEEYKLKMSDTNRVECQDSMYSVIQYSKFKWLKKATKLFDYNFYFWLDAGASRFINNLDIEYPSKESFKQLEGIDNTLLIQYNNEYYDDLVNSKTLTKNYLWDNRSFICGSMFGGNSISIKNINIEIDIIMNYMISHNCVNNEQIVLGYLCKKKEKLFTRFYRTNPKNHLSLFQEML